MSKLKVLCIDSEGGHGGSSISLFTLLTSIKSKNIKLSVICKKDSWIKKEYINKSIICEIEKNIPKLTLVNNYIKNLYLVFSFIIINWNKSKIFRKKLLNKAQHFNLIHLNHINLFCLAFWLKRYNKKIKITMHIRTLPYNNIFNRLICRKLINYIDHFIFISENEKYHFNKLIGKRKISDAIIYNPIKKKEINLKKYAFIKEKKKFILGTVSNYSYLRGLDRLVELAGLMPKSDQKYFLFVIAGDYTLDKGMLNIFYNRKNYSLKELVKSQSLENMFLFLNHISDPESLYPHIDVLIKPTRENNPWGRDIIEAMYFNVPAISIGTYDKFIKNNKSGYLISKYNPNKIISNLKKYLRNNKLLLSHGLEAKKIIEKHCNPFEKARQIEKIWKKPAV